MGNNWTTVSPDGKNYIYGAEQNEAYDSNTNYKTFNVPTIGGLNRRIGVRDGRFVQDIELVKDGFGQLEGIGWTNIFSIF